MIWHAPNKMPESVRDRFTRAHEDVLLFGNSAWYYFDADAVAEPTKRPCDVQTFGGRKGRDYTPEPGDPNYRNGSEQWGRTVTVGDSRNRRDVWSIPTSPMPRHLRNGDETHYAAWPPALVEVMVKAATANRACGTCGTAWVRQVVREGGLWEERKAKGEGMRRGYAQNGVNPVGSSSVIDLGFAPACACRADTARCVVLDPFSGTGTTGAVCEALGRDSILIDLGYQTLQAKRTDGIQLDMEALL